MRILNVNAFITSFKVTWLRRLIIFCGSYNYTVYSGTVIEGLQRPFWILESWIKYIRSYKIESLLKVMCSDTFMYQISTI